MREAFLQVWGAMRLENTAYVEARDERPGSLQRAVLVVLVAGLIAGLGVLGAGGREALFGFNEASVRQDAQAWLDQFESTSDLPPQDLAVVRDGFNQGVDIVVQLANLPTPIPRRLSTLIRSVGAWFSEPFGLAASWLAYSLMTLIAARLLGGKASLPQMLGATALSNAPYALNLFSFVPYCGESLALVAWAWSSVMFVKATAVANELPLARAIAAWLLPAAVMIVLWSLVIAAVVIGLFGLALATA
jgi:hypothetical protein